MLYPIKAESAHNRKIGIIHRELVLKRDLSWQCKLIKKAGPT